jgi:hypothetical protein
VGPPAVGRVWELESQLTVSSLHSASRDPMDMFFVPIANINVPMDCVGCRAV